ncbi:hypothetical protein HDU98_007493 [Podochytrium sp. JEL0797]|nr:hypothetical protein HDU98_007493 [Podochytrium sp. JEL0797]
MKISFLRAAAVAAIVFIGSVASSANQATNPAFTSIPYVENPSIQHSEEAAVSGIERAATIADSIVRNFNLLKHEAEAIFAETKEYLHEIGGMCPRTPIDAVAPFG